MLRNTTALLKFAGTMVLLFSCCVTAGAQAAKSAATTRYILQPGDEVTIQYRYTPEFNQSLKIQPDGFVALELVGELKLSGLTLAEAQALLIEKAKIRLKDPEIGLALKDFEIPHFLVGGEVLKPGKFELRSRTSALQAVLLAGGFSNDAKTSRVVVFRRINPALFEVVTVNLGKVPKNGGQLEDLLLQPGDMVLVQQSFMSRLGRFVKAANIGLFFNPLQFIGSGTTRWENDTP